MTTTQAAPPRKPLDQWTADEIASAVKERAQENDVKGYVAPNFAIPGKLLSVEGGAVRYVLQTFFKDHIFDAGSLLTHLKSLADPPLPIKRSVRCCDMAFST